MPRIGFECEITQGYNFKKDVQLPVGFITKLTLEDSDEISADQKVKKPTAPDEDFDVVAVLSSANWSTGVTDPVYFEGQISVHNRNKIQTKLYNTLANMQVKFEFVVFEYDQEAKTYFEAFHSDGTEMKAVLEKMGDDLHLSVDDRRSTEVQSPMNYKMQIGLVPQPEAQTLTLATASTKNIVKSWGLTVTAGS